MVVIEDTYAQSAVINDPSGQKIGYLRLPSVLRRLQRQRRRSSSADDVKKELAKLDDGRCEGRYFRPALQRRRLADATPWKWPASSCPAARWCRCTTAAA
ncbi:MAG: hypothetical protein WKG07_17395 [Hymenobacter sp.]